MYFRYLYCVVLAIACHFLILPLGKAQEIELSECSFESTGENQYFPLRPGLTLVLEGEEEDDEGEPEEIKLIWEVTSETKEVALQVDGETRTIETRVVRETETVDGELEEISRNFYAHCKETGAVYYFGEEVDIYEDGEIVSHDGAWLAGVDGAEPGVIMPGIFIVGDVYQQASAPEIAEDEVENVEDGVVQTVPFGTFDDSVVIEESDPLEPDSDPSEKIYAPGIGMIVDDVLELTGLELGRNRFPGLGISELHYHPADPTDDEEEAGYEDEDAFEFIEFTNFGEETVDLSGVSFSQGIGFEFPDESLIGPRESVLIVRDEEAMVFRYGETVEQHIVGEFEEPTGLRNRGGETLILVDAEDVPFVVFTFSDRDPWPEAADGDGPSLTSASPISASDLNDPDSWRLSRASGGSPGTADDENDALAKCSFASVGENPYFPLRPGLRLVLEGEDEGESVSVVIEVLEETKDITLEIDGETQTIETRVVRETETANGELTEISRNFYAHCERSGNVYYFGEEVDIYEDGKVAAHDGAWLAGVDGTRPGIIMPGVFALGDTYTQETAPGVAEDHAENVEDDLETEVPAGTFEETVLVEEINPLEPDAEPSEKIYARGIGMIVNDFIELTEFDFNWAGAACNFEPEGDNPYFPLRPGLRLELEGEDEGEFVRLIVDVLDETKEITLMLNGEETTVETRIVRETETVDGELMEISHNYYAHCEVTGSVHYFGEDVDLYENGSIVSHDGAWLAGVDGARPGIIMPGVFIEGDTYAQEIAPGIAEDMAMHEEVGEDTETPFGDFEDTVVVSETNALEPDANPSEKVYAPGIGMIVDDFLELVYADPALSLADRLFSSIGENPYFPLRPGLTLILEGEKEDEDGEVETVQLEWEVLDETKEVIFEEDGEEIAVETRVIRETETIDGEVEEISRNFYAHCLGTGDIYYFGEEVDVFEDGEIVSHDGAWLTGVDDAMPGIIMKGTFRVGDAYDQERAPGVAEDRAVHTGIDVAVTVPARSFTNAVTVEEIDPLEPDDDPSTKTYARDMGMIQDDVLELVDFDLALGYLDGDLATTGENPYFPLRPGLRLVLEGEDEEGVTTVVWEVTEATREITFEIAEEEITVDTRVISETESLDGELVEVGRFFVAHGEDTGEVYFFGEEADIYEDGEFDSLEFGWFAGEDGARPGVIMPGDIEVGESHTNQFAPKDSIDVLEVLDRRVEVETVAALFEDAVILEETSPLEPDAGGAEKVYAAGVGLIVDDHLELIEFNLALSSVACEFSSTGNHPYFPLRPGLTLVLEGEEDGELNRLVWEVTDETREITLGIDGEEQPVETRVVRETHTVEGEMEEVSLNFFAHCEETGSVHYFGEDVDIYEDGAIVSHDGAWLAGVDGALPGIIMPGVYIVGDAYAQETAPGVAEDRAVNGDRDILTETPAGVFEETIFIEETTSLEPNADPSEKIYALGVGLIVDDFLRLVEVKLGAEDIEAVGITEINYNPYPLTEEEKEEGYDDSDDFEFIELTNLGDELLNLAGASFSRGIDFVFPDDPRSRMAPGQSLLVVRDAEAFAFRYGAERARLIAGEFENETGLSNRGEGLELVNAAREEVFTVEYDDADLWPQSPDGDGPTLVWAGPIEDPDFEDPTQWRVSRVSGGNPGGYDPVNEAILDARVTMLEFLEDGVVEVTVENLSGMALDLVASPNLREWKSIDRIESGGGEVTLTDEEAAGENERFYLLTIIEVEN